MAADFNLKQHLKNATHEFDALMSAFDNSGLARLDSAAMSRIPNFTMDDPVDFGPPLASQACAAPAGSSGPLKRSAERVDYEDETPPAKEEAHQAGQQSARNKRRANHRRAQIAAHGHSSSAHLLREHVQLADPIDVDLDAASLDATEGAYSAKRIQLSHAERVKNWTHAELVEERGFTLVAFDPNEAQAFRDTSGRLFLLIAPGLRDKGSYMEAIEGAYDEIEAIGRSEYFSPAELNHRRGKYPALTYGISQGNGNGDAHELKQESHAEAVQLLKDSPHLKAVAGYVDSVFAHWAPDMHRYYHKYLRDVEDAIGVTRNYIGSAFAMATVNIGPKVLTILHRDLLNLAFGWCAITALGRFNHKKGGHLIAWEAKLVIEFPPGATLYIHSATITHANTSIAENEHRALFTQYSGGGIFRWVDNGCKSDKMLREQNPQAFAKVKENRKNKWIEGLGLLGTVKEICKNL